MRATRDWIPPTGYTCPGCGQWKPTQAWCCDGPEQQANDHDMEDK